MSVKGQTDYLSSASFVAIALKDSKVYLILLLPVNDVTFQEYSLKVYLIVIL